MISALGGYTRIVSPLESLNINISDLSIEISIQSPQKSGNGLWNPGISSIVVPSRTTFDTAILFISVRKRIRIELHNSPIGTKRAIMRSIHMNTAILLKSCCIGSMACFLLIELLWLSDPRLQRTHRISAIDVGGRVVRWCWVNFQCRGVLRFGLT